MSDLTYSDIGYAEIPIAVQATYEGYTSWMVTCSGDNTFSEDYHSISVAFYPEYAGNAALGTIVNGGIISGTTDRARVL
jgi:hypothetical protein